MKPFILVTAVLTAMAMASPGFMTITMDATTAAAAVKPTFPPICTFNPQKGEYVCPAIAQQTTTAAAIKATANGDDTSDIKAAVAAADCAKCQRDWDDCMQKWGCWFYDCNNPCKCHVVKNDPSCKDCSAGQCHA